MYCNVLYYQYCCQYCVHQYYNIIMAQPELLMTHSVSTNICNVLPSAPIK
jgi:hypothetical protein